MRESVPLSQRKSDIAILAFFWLNILFITYQVDIEQLVIADPEGFEYPVWPLPFVVDMVHWWGRNFDPTLMARPMWFKMTIWLDEIFFGPFYVFAIYAYTKGKEWIRIPSIIYASVIMTNVAIILGEEFWGVHPAPNAAMVALANGPWLLLPAFIIYRMWSDEHPFSRPVSSDTEAA